ncbi:hypothetical protein JCM17844_27380 [Iodidimonas gelatinilytica]|uniref:TonB C-terminal domain-containing protein n=1 Tax=Iodidimonas gelatinilytica TaxID=1236966 RepID=A0A5A7MT19_9PROT|nr:TonB family protein [Iodidimonas gelatinilytica]GEQ99101.1 hypothetical protein JCM17844_27380 [Iodidimonas gelatinilytica]
MFARIMMAASLLVAVAIAATPKDSFAAGASDWQMAVARTIADKQVYPRSALMRQMEGTAKVKMTVDRTGAIKSYEVVQATGVRVLDNEVERLMERVNPLPKPPSDMGDEYLTFILPLSWALQ